jgi:hypothetical protein
MSRIAPQTASTRRPRRRLMALAALAGAMLTLALSGQAFAAYQDLRSPDARDAARLSELATPATSYQDLRSPDARDAARLSEQSVRPTSYRDLRSPDAADAGRQAEQGGYQDLRSPDARDAGRLVPQAPVASSSPSSDGFDWGYLAIGAAALLLLIGVGTRITRSLRLDAKSSVPTS